MSQNVNEPIDPQSPIDPTLRDGSGGPGVVFPTASRITGTYTSSEHYNRGARGVRLNLVIAPTGAATGTVQIKVQVPDPVTNIWTDLTGTAGGFATVNGTGSLTGTPYLLYPLGAGADSTGAGAVVNTQLGPRWRAVATVALATLSFSVGADYLL